MCVIWGIPYLLIKVSVAEVSPVFLVFVRTGIGAALLFPVAIRRGHLASLLGRWRVIVLYTVVELAVPWLLLSDAERRLSSSISGLLLAAVPLVIALVARLGGWDRRLQQRQVLGLLVGLAGVGVLLGFGPVGGDLTAVLEMGVVIVGYSIGPIIISRRLAGLPATGVIAASLVLTALAYTPAALLQLPARLPSGGVVASMATLGVICTAIGFLIFFALIDEAGPTRATVITYVNPAVAVAVGVAILGEPFSAAMGAGFVLILAGSFLAAQRRSSAGAAAVAASRCQRPDNRSQTVPARAAATEFHKPSRS